MRDALLNNAWWKSFSPLDEEICVLLLVSKVIGKHDWYLFYDGIVSAALVAQKHSVDDFVVMTVEFREPKRVVLVDGTRKDAEQPSAHELGNYCPLLCLPSERLI